MKLLPVLIINGGPSFVNPDAIDMITNDSESECTMTIHFRGTNFSRVSLGEGRALIDAINAEKIKEEPK